MIKHLYKKYTTIILVSVVLLNCSTTIHQSDELKLIKAISLPSVKGRIDHMDVNIKDRIVYVAALGNNSVEVVDIAKGIVMHSIKTVDEPQGIAYIPQQQEIFNACGGNGDCYFYNANSFEKTATIHLSSDADDVRYDSINEQIYVGYGEGGIAVIDAGSHNQTADIKLTGHPEGFHEGFANIYSDAAEAIAARRSGKQADPLALYFPNSQDGLLGVRFVNSVIESSKANGKWTKC
jgi:WD40 repeat protein